MDQSNPKSRNSLQYLEGISLVAATIAKTAQTTAFALIEEHPYALMFLLVFGFFLFPLSTTAIAGTLFLILATAGVIFISVVFFAPALFMLTILASGVWLLSALLLGIYRYMITRKQSNLEVDHLSARYKVFRSTLESQEGTYSQHQIMNALATSTPEKTILKKSLRELELNGRDPVVDQGKRSSFRANARIAVKLEELVSTKEREPQVAAKNLPEGSDFFPRAQVDFEAGAADPAASPAEAA